MRTSCRMRHLSFSCRKWCAPSYALGGPWVIGAAASTVWAAGDGGGGCGKLAAFGASSQRRDVEMRGCEPVIDAPLCAAARSRAGD